VDQQVFEAKETDRAVFDRVYVCTLDRGVEMGCVDKGEVRFDR